MSMSASWTHSLRLVDIAIRISHDAQATCSPTSRNDQHPTLKVVNVTSERNGFRYQALVRSIMHDIRTNLVQVLQSLR